MNITGIALTPGRSHNETAPLSEELRLKRQQMADTVLHDNVGDENGSAEAIQPEELLQNIKALTEDGLYSVRFEMHAETHDLVINLIDQNTGEVIRQLPPEEIIGARQYLADLRGNIVETES